MIRPRPTLHLGVTALAAVTLSACAGAPAAPTSEERGAATVFAPWAPATFARARAERRPVLLHLAASWCHWCHVMEEETYGDARVAALVRDRFVAVRVDSDARPDLGERYAAYGWPGTILLSPDGEELAKYRGFIPPDRFLALLDAALAARPDGVAPPLGDPAPPVAALPFVARAAAAALDRTWDRRNGGWGGPKKPPNGLALAWTCRLAARGDAGAGDRAARTVTAQRALLDPVWGGFYQYSETRDWTRPHTEKLTDLQGWALEGLAACDAALGGGAQALADADQVLAWLDGQMTAPDGTLMTSQDADLGTHGGPRVVRGADFYALDDAGRRALGAPWIDAHTYPRDNGFVLAGLAALAERDPRYAPAARRLAEAARAAFVGDDGAVRRGEGPLRFLADAAALGHGLARAAEALGEPRFADAARAVWDRALADLAAPGGALYEATEDPAATGVFARRDTPFDANVRFARLGAALARLGGGEPVRDRARAVLAAVATNGRLDAQGAWLGDLLVAADELGVTPWADHDRTMTEP